MPHIAPPRDVLRTGGQRIGDERVGGGDVAIVAKVEIVIHLLAGGRHAIALGKILINVEIHPRQGHPCVIGVPIVLVFTLRIVADGDDAVPQMLPDDRLLLYVHGDVQPYSVAWPYVPQRPDYLPVGDDRRRRERVALLAILSEDTRLAAPGGQAGAEGQRVGQDHVGRRVRTSILNRDMVSHPATGRPRRGIQILVDLQVRDRGGPVGRGGIVVAVTCLFVGGRDADLVDQGGALLHPIRDAHREVDVPILARLHLAQRPDDPPVGDGGSDGLVEVYVRVIRISIPGGVGDARRQRVGQEHVVGDAVAVVGEVQSVTHQPARRAPDIHPFAHIKVPRGDDDSVGAGVDVVGRVGLALGHSNGGHVDYLLPYGDVVGDADGQVDGAAPSRLQRPDLPAPATVGRLNHRLLVAQLHHVRVVELALPGEVGHTERPGIGEHHIGGGHVALVLELQQIDDLAAGQRGAAQGFRDADVPRPGDGLRMGVDVVVQVGVRVAGSDGDGIGQQTADGERVVYAHRQIDPSILAGRYLRQPPDDLPARDRGRDQMLQSSVIGDADVTVPRNVGHAGRQRVGDDHVPGAGVAQVPEID